MTYQVFTDGSSSRNRKTIGTSYIIFKNRGSEPIRTFYKGFKDKQARNDISDLLDRLDSHHTELIDNIVVMKLKQYKSDYSLCYENLKSFIESEEKAHGKHTDEQIREYIERSKKHEKNE